MTRNAKRPRLQGEDHVLQFVVEKCKGEALTSKAVHAAIRNMQYTLKSGKKCAEVVNDVLNRLIAGSWQKTRG